MRSALAVLLGCLLTVGASATASQPAWPPPMQPIGPPAFPGSIRLDTETAGSRDDRESWVKTPGGRMVRNVTSPALIPVLPPPVARNGAAVIIAPGGGFAMLSMDSEGFAVARRLAEHGIAAFVLKYRLNPTPADQEAFLARLGVLAAQPPLRAGQTSPIVMPEGARQDALAAMRLVRRRAVEWGVDPRRIGVVGFSAGAMTALDLVMHADITTMPDFVGYIYGPMGSVQVPGHAPPLFAALALDDRLFGQMGYGLIQSWQDAHRPAELHVYQKGDHGFGLGAPGTTSVDWFDSFLHWLSCDGVISGCTKDQAVKEQ